jgi:AraC-like DNA-binding protein
MLLYAGTVGGRDDEKNILSVPLIQNATGTGKASVLLVISGRGELFFRHESKTVSEGSIVVISGDVEYRVKAGGKYRAILICGSFSLLSGHDGVIFMNDNEHNEGRRLAELIIINKAGNEGYLSILCDAFVRYILINAVRSPRNTSAAISRIILRMEKEFGSSDLSIGNLLDESGYTRDYIRSEFESVTGMTPKKYLNSVRMSKAKTLIELCAEDMTISEIAERCGVIDPTIFSRVFKKHFGISPSQYRDSLTNKKTTN